jgi:AcrR family transcriptional regulator
MAREAAAVAGRGGTRNPGAVPRRPIDYAAVAAAFAEEGFHRATMDSVAGRAGVAKPTLYRYFESKEELFEAAVSAECERLIDHLSSAYERAQELPLHEQIRANTAAYFSYVRENPDTFELLFRGNLDRSSEVSRRIERTFDRVVERMADVFRRQLADRDSPAGQVADVLAAATVGTSYFAARDLMRHPEWDPDAVVELIAELWTRSLTTVSRKTLARADRAARGAQRGSLG